MDLDDNDMQDAGRVCDEIDRIAGDLLDVLHNAYQPGRRASVRMAADLLQSILDALENIRDLAQVHARSA